MRIEVSNFLVEMKNQALERAKDSIFEVETALQKAYEKITMAKEALKKSRDKEVLKLNSINIYDNAKSRLTLARNKVGSGDYVAFVDAKLIADQAFFLANKTTQEACREREHYERRRAEKVKRRGYTVLYRLLVCLSFMGYQVVSAVIY